jgi:hypothetical protein
MMLAIVRRFRFGSEIEDYIKAMKEPAPPDDGKAEAQQQMQMEQQKQQATQAAKQQDQQFELEKAKAAETRMQAVEMAKHRREQEAEKNRMQLEREQMENNKQIELQKIQANKEAELAKLQAERVTEKMKMDLEQQTELKKADMQIQAQIVIEKIKAGVAISGGEGNIDMDRIMRSATGERPKEEVDSLKELADSIRSLTIDNQMILKTLMAPRKRTAIRGKDGKIEASIEEMTMQ